MPRKPTKKEPSTAPRSSSKRPPEETPERQSKRARAAPRKSYVEPETDEEDRVPKKQSESSENYDGNDAGASSFEEQSEGEASSESGEDEEVSSDDNSKSKKKPSRGRSGKQNLSVRSKAIEKPESWSPGTKLAPGTQLIIKKPKARDAGDTPYLDDTIHPNTMLFLKDLMANNDRQWLKMHDPDYRAAFQDFSTFAEKVSEKIIEHDELIPELPVKDVIYRIYRDVRFSKDPTPYKTYFSAAWSRTGRKGPYAHYYVQIQPNGGSFVGGGYWQPEATALSKLRQDIDRKPHKIKRVLTDEGIRKTFLGNAADNDRKAVKAFVNLSSNQANALKRNPKGYDHDHKDIELLRLRNFTIGKKLPDHEVIGSEGLQRISAIVAAMVPFITYLNSVVMPDEESSASSEEDEGEEHDDDEEDGSVAALEDD